MPFAEQSIETHELTENHDSKTRENDKSRLRNHEKGKKAFNLLKMTLLLISVTRLSKILKNRPHTRVYRVNPSLFIDNTLVYRPHTGKFLL